MRSFWRNGGVAFGTPLYRLQTLRRGRGYFRSFANFSPVPLIEPPGTERAAGLTGQTGLEVAVLCGGGGSCRTPAATLDVTGAALVLRDPYAPSIERVTGSLLSDGPLTGIRALRYTAADRGGGVARAELTVDGVPVAEQVADVNGGAARRSWGNSPAVPCRPRATNTLTFDTRVLPTAQTRYACGCTTPPRSTTLTGRRGSPSTTCPRRPTGSCRRSPARHVTGRR